MSEFRPTTVKSWTIERGKGVFINGEMFRYHVDAQGPMVEQIPDFEDMHILWMPLIAEGPAPRAGRPDGEPVICDICRHPAHGTEVCGLGKGEGPTMCACTGVEPR